MKTETWGNIQSELRKLRGKNKLRGREEHLLNQNLIRLEVEWRGGEMSHQEIHIHLTDSERELWAEAVPSGEKFYLKDFENDLSAFLGHLVDLCRGKGGYLRTNSKKAEYRKE